MQQVCERADAAAAAPPPCTQLAPSPAIHSSVCTSVGPSIHPHLISALSKQPRLFVSVCVRAHEKACQGQRLYVTAASCLQIHVIDWMHVPVHYSLAVTDHMAPPPPPPPSSWPRLPLHRRRTGGGSDKRQNEVGGGGGVEVTEVKVHQQQREANESMYYSFFKIKSTSLDSLI